MPANEPIFSTDQAPRRADAVQNRLLLLETAQRLFTDEGVEMVSMSQIAQAAGVGKGTLYRHFANKAEVCYALLDSEQRDLQERTFQHLRENPDPYENLRWFLQQALGFVVRHHAMLSSGLDIPKVSPLSFPAHHWWHITIRRLLERIGVPGDLEYTSDVLYVMVSVDTIHYQLHTLHYSEDRIREGVQTTLDRLVNV
jgi:AcrR family transcriptional regulator